ncbi:MAG: isoprenylcysteine carboxylmethyltransferase family protein [Cyclobacteriaceae bacterium]
MKLGFLVLGWAIYFFLHSLLASDSTKTYFRKWLVSNYRYYRLGYVLFSVLGLLTLLVFNGSIYSAYYFNNEGIARYLSLVFAAFGVIIIKLAFRAYSLSTFLGITVNEMEPFKATGILASIRHPIYSGTILIVIGFWLFSPNMPTLISAICVFVYLPIGIFLEERKLIKEFGDRYLDYKRKTPALFPKIF